MNASLVIFQMKDFVITEKGVSEKDEYRVMYPRCDVRRWGKFNRNQSNQFHNFFRNYAE